MRTLFLDDEKELALIERVNQVYVENGLKDITMDAMSKTLNVSKKTLYKYVKNRKELVYKSTLFHIKRDKEFIDSILAKGNNPIQELHEIAQFVLITLTKINPQVHYDLEHYFKDSWKLLDDYYNDFIHKTYLNNLIQGQQQGYYREDLNAGIVSKLFTAKTDIIYDSDMFNPSEYSFSEVYVEYLLYHLRSITTEKGMQTIQELDFKTLYK